jgi:signal transduction histidine kinase
MKPLALASEDQKDDRWLGLQDCLRQSQNLAVAGQFAATIMHEINNPLEAISNLIFLVQRNSDNPGLVLQFSQQIEEQLTVLTRIARQTLSFYRPSAEKSLLAAATLAGAALRIHQKSIAAKQVRLNLRLPSDVTVEVHPGEMLQVISNLVANAVDALPVNGTLYVRGRRSTGGVSILVADNGHGIPASIAAQVYDPFFTTKKDKGTGLGLAISKAIVERHHGKIRSRSSTKSGRSGDCIPDIASTAFQSRQRHLVFSI